LAEPKRAGLDSNVKMGWIEIVVVVLVLFPFFLNYWYYTKAATNCWSSVSKSTLYKSINNDYQSSTAQDHFNLPCPKGSAQHGQKQRRI
jgi:ABC-type sulfate transport system permease component